MSRDNERKIVKCIVSHAQRHTQASFENDAASNQELPKNRIHQKLIRKLNLEIPKMH